MKCYDLFGTTKTQEQLRLEVEKLLGMEFTPRESWYWGGNYYSHETADGTSLIIRNNKDIDPGELAEPDFPDSPVLFEVSEAETRATAELLVEKVPGLVVLKQSAF